MNSLSAKDAMHLGRRLRELRRRYGKLDGTSVFVGVYGEMARQYLAMQSR